jgi:hypothetical protein
VRSFNDVLPHGWIARQLPRLFREHGLTDVTVVPHQLFPFFEFYDCCSAATSFGSRSKAY